jgi:hypothetical protein
VNNIIQLQIASKTYNSQHFLNLLEDNEPSDFEAAVYASGTDNYLDLVNRRHVSSSLNLDQLRTMKSLRPQDGQLYLNLINTLLTVFF